MAAKAKGSAAERELLTMLWGVNFAAIRAAGSGVTRFYCPDIIASNGRKILAIECKATKHKHQYLDPEQVRQLQAFSDMFKAEPWIAVRFSKEWKFFKPNDLKKTAKALAVNKQDKGRLFADLIS